MNNKISAALEAAKKALELHDKEMEARDGNDWGDFNSYLCEKHLDAISSIDSALTALKQEARGDTNYHIKQLEHYNTFRPKNTVAHKRHAAAIEHFRTLTAPDERTPRPLRELIAEGHDLFWLLDKKDEFGTPCLCGLSGDKSAFIEAWETHDTLKIYAVEDYADYRAIPIIKPAIDGVGK